MKMISTPSAVAANQYPAYVYNCLRNPACEPSYSAPLPGVPYLQLYVDFGQYKPATVEFHLIDTCAGGTEQIFPSNYVVGLSPEGTWYGVFKYFNSPVTPVTTFVVWLSALVDTPAGLQERTFFSQMLMDEPCAPLTKIKACQPEGATTTGFDVNGVYYGLPTTEDFLGQSQIRFFHIAWVRQGKVRELQNKATFKSSLIKNFRTTVEKIHQVETELVPKWYKDELLAIYARGAISVNDGQIYLVSDLNFEAINDDDLQWKPYAQLKETFRLYFGCDDSECVECCSPIVLSASASSEASSGSEPEPSGSTSESEASASGDGEIDGPMFMIVQLSAGSGVSSFVRAKIMFDPYPGADHYGLEYNTTPGFPFTPPTTGWVAYTILPVTPSNTYFNTAEDGVGPTGLNGFANNGFTEPWVRIRAYNASNVVIGETVFLMPTGASIIPASGNLAWITDEELTPNSDDGFGGTIWGTTRYAYPGDAIAEGYTLYFGVGTPSALITPGMNKTQVLQLVADMLQPGAITVVGDSFVISNEFVGGFPRAYS